MKITHKMQEVAVDILTDLEILLFTKEKTVALEKIKTIIDFNRDKYNLCEDPFTKLTCTSREYEKNSLEYQRQAMIEKYGHCDGLE